MRIEANFVFVVRINSYSNPDNRLADGSCCDFELFNVCILDGCDKYFDNICLREAGHPHRDSSHCPLGNHGNGFEIIPNEITIKSTQPWPVSFILLLSN